MINVKQFFVLIRRWNNLYSGINEHPSILGKQYHKRLSSTGTMGPDRSERKRAYRPMNYLLKTESKKLDTETVYLKMTFSDDFVI